MASVTKKARQDQPRGEISMHAVTAAVETEANLEVSRSAPGLLQLSSIFHLGVCVLLLLCSASLEDLDSLLPLALWWVSPCTCAKLDLGLHVLSSKIQPQVPVEVCPHM